MKILAMEKKRPGKTPEDFAPYLKEETRKVWELNQSGVIRETYLRADRNEAVLVLECADLKEATKILDSLPLVKRGLIDFDIVPLRPYPGFSRLFA